MLLPSALSCDSRQYPTRSRFASSRLFPSTPPPSDDGFIAGNGLLGTCRALQSLLNSSPVSSPRRAKPERLQSPLHVRHQPITRAQKVMKPAQKAPRGINKRRRDVYEDDSDLEIIGRDIEDGFSTPKRRRRAPIELPMGLARSDFRSLESPLEQGRSMSPSRGRIHTNDDTKHDCDEQLWRPNNGDNNDDIPSDVHSDWTSEDDRRLVELVLEKLKLSKRDWNECARKMGKDNDSVGRRWKALVGEGNVGLRKGRRMVRGRIHDNWRCDT
ncbi:hypothetical protein AJ79_00609 [Helicocarpus griseus UAMH5409]|uniref:Myb-like domain-containing protein n=1 Tax=Helicocarpus griseus UAMH5409 TaxID=1447875 RepID=A0A2B7YAQ4_9EURO|nr:hypothetical protein AJ79_00609 [Helicocarpus griseus UAMH5409]